MIAFPALSGPFLDRILTALSELGAARGIRVLAGVSRAGRDLPAAHREAVACLRFARLSGGSRPIVRADELGVMRFLSTVQDVEPLREFVQHQLGPLLEHGRGRSGELFATARVFAESEGHHPTVAKTCTIHPSTVKYRLSRITMLLGRSLRDPQVRFELRLAFSVLDFLEATGLNGRGRKP